MKETPDIESLIEVEDWPAARRAIRQGLRADPDDHWLLTRLSLTYYEERKYGKAVQHSKRALEIERRCPLALWDYAGALQMLGRHREAIKVFRKLIRRGARRIAYGLCGEGLAWANGLVADCWYRISLSYDAVGNRAWGTRAFVRHLDLRGPGCQSIYPLGQLCEELAERNKRPSKRRTTPCT